MDEPWIAVLNSRPAQAPSSRIPRSALPPDWLLLPKPQQP